MAQALVGGARSLPAGPAGDPARASAGGVVATARAQVGEEAVEVGTAAFELVPTHQDLQRGLELWRQQVKRLHTTNTVLGLADLLVQHDEQGKALELLDACAPYYVHSDPRFVAYRSALRERLGALTDAQPQDERGIPDEDLGTVVPMLSRAGFLLNGVREQLELAA